MSSLTEKLSEFSANLSYDRLSEKEILNCKRAILDTVGCTIAGSREEGSTILLDAVRRESQGLSPVIAHDIGLSPSFAALVNGTMAHALDFDDVNDAVQGHPSVAILPAALAAVESARGDGRALITSYVAGFEVMAALGVALGPSHYAMGWHPTVTLGTLGATAAAINGLHLDQAQAKAAFGLAVSQVAGTRQNFGTMTKPFHAGNAARIGLFSAELAHHGFTASNEIFDAPMGFFHLYSADEKITKQNAEKAFSQLGIRYSLSEDGISVKKYPCCFGTHRALDAILALVNAHDLYPAQVQRIDVATSPEQLRPLIYDHPATGLEAKFSMEYVVTAAVVDHKIGFASFADEAVHRRAIDELLPKVYKHADSTLSGTGEGLSMGRARVIVETIDGQQYEQEVEYPRGSAQAPLSWNELVQKVDDCIAFAEQDVDADLIAKHVQSLDHEELYEFLNIIK